MKCQKCNHEMEFKQGVTTTRRMEQYYCPNCHNSVVFREGKIIEGIIKEKWIQTDYGSQAIYYIEERK